MSSRFNHLTFLLNLIFCSITGKPLLEETTPLKPNFLRKDTLTSYLASWLHHTRQVLIRYSQNRSCDLSHSQNKIHFILLILIMYSFSFSYWINYTQSKLRKIKKYN